MVERIIYRTPVVKLDTKGDETGAYLSKGNSLYSAWEDALRIVERLEILSEGYLNWSNLRLGRTFGTTIEDYPSYSLARQILCKTSPIGISPVREEQRQTEANEKELVSAA